MKYLALLSDGSGWVCEHAYVHERVATLQQAQRLAPTSTLGQWKGDQPPLGPVYAVVALHLGANTDVTLIKIPHTDTLQE